jgi:hypothetical protein
VTLWREFGAGFKDPEWQECESPRDPTRRYQECVYCFATRNDNRNGASTFSTHRPWCPSITVTTIVASSGVTS